MVAGALIIGGVTQLSSFEIPQTLLGILGLSQVVYIGGKLVTPTTMADLNKSIGDLREAERKFRASAVTANNGVLPAASNRACQSDGVRCLYDARDGCCHAVYGTDGPRRRTREASAFRIGGGFVLDSTFPLGV